MEEEQIPFIRDAESSDDMDDEVFVTENESDDADDQPIGVIPEAEIADIERPLRQYHTRSRRFRRRYQPRFERAYPALIPDWRQAVTEMTSQYLDLSAEISVAGLCSQSLPAAHLASCVHTRMTHLCSWTSASILIAQSMPGGVYTDFNTIVPPPLASKVQGVLLALSSIDRTHYLSDKEGRRVIRRLAADHGARIDPNTVELESTMFRKGEVLPPVWDDDDDHILVAAIRRHRFDWKTIQAAHFPAYASDWIRTQFVARTRISARPNFLRYARIQWLKQQWMSWCDEEAEFFIEIMEEIDQMLEESRAGDRRRQMVRWMDVYSRMKQRFGDTFGPPADRYRLGYMKWRNIHRKKGTTPMFIPATREELEPATPVQRDGGGQG
ncbi:hypothetical protein J8273_7757 [Carpediemonas membranifera]|uniref:Uncharacterized protein n=1 Tax=Carpediemonas membranifera TaxID=201153 RepID=A0A8J6B0J4_9EUKA|nr:hypothetical protein J8273_7757 [Carpediemonas membranifera]|eukprot:KAG9390407.1 hypothetical protein J8273_7757 [Carpediemonas membranifera]